ncbi:MAG: hypothetical protein N4A45_02445 [Flavobacteriales bacterium]|jgi:DNA mismatch repair protein MutS2|nr:hypothetical protein [Flavobacteriales bacterium]
MKKIKNSVKEELEFSKVLDWLKEHSESEKNKTYFQNIQPYSTIRNLGGHFCVLEEFSHLQEDTVFPSFQYKDLIKINKVLRIENAILQIDDFFDLLTTIDWANKVIRYFKNNVEGSPMLRKMFEVLGLEKVLVKEILKVFNAQKEVKSTASNALQEIRIKKEQVRRSSAKKFQSAVTRYGKNGFLAETVETYMDNTRLLAVLAEHKKKVSGRRFGESKSGNVVYIEPQECSSYNRDFFNLLEEEKEEIRKILLELTQVFRERKDFVKEQSIIQEKLDRLHAIIRVGKLYSGVIPKISKQRKMVWKDAFHPLLVVNYKDKGRKVFPQNIELSDYQNMIVISGPNAGGKSISLKTVGLLQLMFQCGIKVPVHSDSTFCMIEEIFTDIGDNQSIENELSTYSHRLKKMKEILEFSTPNSMILIDEFGSGSDPILGGALASVFFEELYKKGSFSVLTTHYGVIKLMAEEMSGVQNASMLFDEKKLKPLYQLHVGRPGSSFTFEVAQNIGIPEEIIRKGKEKVSDENMKYEELVNQYQKLNTALEFEKQNLRKKTKRTHTLKKEFDKKLEYLDQKEKNLIGRVEENDRQLNLGKKLEKIIIQYKRGRKTREVFQQFKKLVETESRVEVTTKKRPPVFKERKSEEMPDFKEGDLVRLVGGSDAGQIIELKRTKATVLFGNLKTQIDLNKIEKIRKDYRK